MSKIALMVGINDYDHAPLKGCIKDAARLKNLLDTHHNGDKNFECKLMVSSQDTITRAALKKTVEYLFTRPTDVALFYFAGHGTMNNLGGFLVTQDAHQYDEGMGMTDVLKLANKSPARERIIILDCCHSGTLGNLPEIANDTAMLKEGTSVLSAARSSEAALELTNGDGGLFTSLVCDALAGGAADVTGKVTVASIYAYADEVLGGWGGQRPLFKSHVSQLVSLRNCLPAVKPCILRLLPTYFPTADYEYPLDPSYEPDAEPNHPEHEAIFAHLQKLRDGRLVVPVSEEHLYFAAMRSKSCRLTAHGAFYWHLAKAGKI